jgi:NAD(P)H-dependent FMN reductase
MSVRAARYLHARLLATERVETAILDLAAYNFPIMEERLHKRDDPPQGLREFAEKVARADVLAIVSPEYNHGYPGVLKNALDYLGPELRRKPLAIATVSNGPWGGLRCLEQLRLVSFGFGAFPIPADLPFARVAETLEEDGTPKSPDVERRVEAFVREILWFAEAISSQKARDAASKSP